MQYPNRWHSERRQEKRIASADIPRIVRNLFDLVTVDSDKREKCAAQREKRSGLDIAKELDS